MRLSSSSSPRIVVPTALAVKRIVLIRRGNETGAMRKSLVFVSPIEGVPEESCGISIIVVPQQCQWIQFLGGST